MESVSIVAKRNLENLLKDDFEVVQVVRDYGAHAGCDLFLAFFSLCSAFTASSNVLLDGILIACHLVILAGNQASGNASAQLHLSVGDIMLVSNRGSQVRHASPLSVPTCASSTLVRRMSIVFGRGGTLAR